MTKPFWSLHTHSKYSANDAMPAIQDMVDRAVLLDYPALGLTDHGTPAGAVQLYKSCRKAGIEPLPGEEFYITPDREARVQANHHITIAAYDETGYRNLVGLHNMAQTNPVTSALTDVLTEFVHDPSVTPETAQLRLAEAAEGVR